MNMQELKYELFKFIFESGVRGETTPDEWLRIIDYFCSRNLIRYVRENGKITAVVGFYRIKEYEQKHEDQVPQREEGDKLMISFVASNSNDKWVFKRMLTQYLRDNPNVNEIIYNLESQDEKLKRYNLKGVLHG